MTIRPAQRPRDVRPPSRMAGMSLIELMISITIGLVILTAISLVFSNASRSRNEIERNSRQIENGRYAIEVLSDDLRLAGFYGELSVGSLAAPAALPDPCSTSAADWANAIPMAVFGYDGGVGAPATCLPASLSFQPNTDILVIRRARTCYSGAGGAAYCGDTVTNGLPYVQVSLCASETTAYKIGLQGTAAFDLKKKDCTATAEKRQYYVNIYYISTTNGANGAGTAVPTLKRLEFNGASWTDNPLVEGIEHFNIEYGIDTDGDGAPDVYTADPSDYPVGTCPALCQVTNWSNVVTARIYVLARNLEVSQDTIVAKTYTLGKDKNGAAVTVTPADNVRRHVYSSLVRIINPSSRKDTP